MRRLLADRNAVLKRVAESDEWQRYLPAGARVRASERLHPTGAFRNAGAARMLW